MIMSRSRCAVKWLLKWLRKWCAAAVRAQPDANGEADGARGTRARIEHEMRLSRGRVL